MIAAALCFTLMNLRIKAATQKFGLYNGELVFWRMGFAAAMLGITIKAQDRTFFTPHWKTHLNRGVIGSAAMLCLFYTVIHLPLATRVTLSYTSSIFLTVLSFLIFKEHITPYTQAVLVLGFTSMVLLLNPSFDSGQETVALAGLAGGAMPDWACLQVRELSLLDEPDWHVVFYFSVTGMVLGAGWTAATDQRIPAADMLPYLYAVGLSTLVAQLSVARAHKAGNRFTVASLSYLAVIFSSLVDIMLLGDKTT